MMLLSRFWYAVLAVLAAFALYAVFLAVGQFNRRSVAGANEALASDAAVVRWGLKIDARYRLDALLDAALVVAHGTPLRAGEVELLEPGEAAAQR